MKFAALTLIVISVLLLSSCGNKLTPQEKQYIKDVQQFRQEKDNYMRDDPDSPFNQDSLVEFAPLKYYNINSSFVFKNKMVEYPQKDTVIVFGTKGEPRKVLRYGYINFDYLKNKYKVNIYKGMTSSGEQYSSIWFTDKTTGSDTYGVGRYIDFDINPDSNYVYTVDFNMAYNPYCAYSSKYSCAIPTKEDYIDIAITAGEKKFH
jgi:uncharacterized protein